MRTTRADVLQALAAMPALSAKGFTEGPPVAVTDDLVAQVDAARRWCENPPRGRATDMYRAGSYAVKHLIEADLDTYIEHTAAIIAARLAGWRPVVSLQGGPTCLFRRANAR